MQEIIERAAAEGSRIVIGNHNLHSLYLYHHDRDMRAFYESAEYVHIDGMPIIQMLRLFGFNVGYQHRIAYIDWLPELMNVASRKGLRLFYLGSAPGVADRAASMFRDRFPGLQFGTAHGYFDTKQGSAENEAVLGQINSYRPHVLIVGMGMPRQELWVAANADRISANAILSSAGATMDYFSGVLPTPPRWSGRVGLEWLFRFASEPQRLFRRYFVEGWFVAWLLFVEVAQRAMTPVDRQHSE